MFLLKYSCFKQQVGKLGRSSTATLDVHEMACYVLCAIHLFRTWTFWTTRLGKRRFSKQMTPSSSMRPSSTSSARHRPLLQQPFPCFSHSAYSRAFHHVVGPPCRQMTFVRVLLICFVCSTAVDFSRLPHLPFYAT